MKKIILSLTLILCLLSQAAFGTMAPAKFAARTPRNLIAKNAKGHKRLAALKQKAKASLQNKQCLTIVCVMLLTGAEISHILTEINNSQTPHIESRTSKKETQIPTPSKEINETLPLIKRTPTIAQAEFYCENEPNCTLSCGSSKTIQANTHNFTLCALMHKLSTPEMQTLQLNTPENNPHIRNLFETILHRAQMHPEHLEFFHGFSAYFGLDFDIFTELARQANLADPENPSPFFLRLSSKNFDKYAPNVEFFLHKTLPQANAPDYPDSTHLTSPGQYLRTSELLLSTNIALGANCKMLSSGECTLAFFLNNGFLFKTGRLPKISIDFLSIPDTQEILDLYKQYPELQTGQLIQIFIPKKMAQSCVYLSINYGQPITEPKKNFWGTYYEVRPDPSARISELAQHASEYIQARVLPHPRLAKNFIVYRYYATAQAEQADKVFHEKLKDIIARALSANKELVKILRKEVLG